jgi:hypothetical protein
MYVRIGVLIRFKFRPDSTLTRQLSNSPMYVRRNQKNILKHWLKTVAMKSPLVFDVKR